MLERHGRELIYNWTKLLGELSMVGRERRDSDSNGEVLGEEG